MRVFMLSPQTFADGWVDRAVTARLNNGAATSRRVARVGGLDQRRSGRSGREGRQKQSHRQSDEKQAITHDEFLSTKSRINVMMRAPPDWPGIIEED
jgi:hypothetical protein